MSRQIDPLKTRLRAFLTMILCSTGIILCGNSACDSIGDYEGKEQDLGVDMSVVEDMAGESDMREPIDMQMFADMTHMPDMSGPSDMNSPADQGMDMQGAEDMANDMADPGMACERARDCEQSQTNVVASCNGLGICSYVCSSEDFAVTDGEDIAVEGCTCEIEEEICDGRDNDCDGEVDEGLTTACVEQRGVCAGSVNICTGVPATFNDKCEMDRYTEHGLVTQMAFTSDVQEDFRCDGLDNDCDGTADEACCHGPDPSPIHLRAKADRTSFNIFHPPGSDPSISGLAMGVFRSGEHITWSTINIPKSQYEFVKDFSVAYLALYSTSCQHLGNTQLAASPSATSSQFVIMENCKSPDNKYYYYIHSVPYGDKPMNQAATAKASTWHIKSEDAPTGADPFELVSDGERFLLAAWNVSTNNDYELQWCLSSSPAVDCGTNTPPQSIKSTYPGRPSLSINDIHQRGIIGFNNPNSAALNDEERIVEISNTGAFIEEHVVRFSSTIGGSRHIIDHQVAWIDVDTILVAHLVDHSTNQSNQLYLATYSLSTKTILDTKTVNIPTYANERAEAALLVIKENDAPAGVLVVASHPAVAIRSTYIPLPLPSTPVTWREIESLTTDARHAANLKLSMFDGLVAVSFVEDESALDLATNELIATTSVKYISREGQPICDVLVDLPAP